VWAYLVVACVVGSALSAHATSADHAVGTAASRPLEGLDYAFRFASAIYNDDKDRAKAQQAVVRDYIELGEFDEASRRIPSIEGWRQAVVLADLGRAMAEAGRTDEARQAVVEARSLRKQITDFHGPRIDYHVAQAMAAMGDVEGANEIRGAVAEADRVQYLGRTVATRAMGYAREGEFDAAMEYLRNFEPDNSIDDPDWWRTQAYLEIAGMDQLPREQRLEAMGSARESLEAVRGARYSEGILAVAATSRALGEPVEVTSEVLDQGEAYVDRTPDNYPSKPYELTSLARVWTEIGRSERARALLKRAESIVPISQPIEQPAAFAWIACSYLLLDDTADSRRLYDRALAVAETLVNPRPRALALVAIGRSMGQQGVELSDPLRHRLDRALAGLKPPAPAGST
jgi:tetratricopeptide (TPR) repeat protein